MPANAASESIHLPAKDAEHHLCQFAVYSTLAGELSDLEQHLPEHLKFMNGLQSRGILPIAGPFFTPEGKNSGNGFYVLKVDSLEEAEQITAEDPMHQSGIRKAVIQPWLQMV